MSPGNTVREKGHKRVGTSGFGRGRAVIKNALRHQTGRQAFFGKMARIQPHIIPAFYAARPDTRLDTRSYLDQLQMRNKAFYETKALSQSVFVCV